MGHHPGRALGVLSAAAALAGACAACGAAAQGPAGGTGAGGQGALFGATTVSVSTSVSGEGSANSQLPGWLPSAAAPTDQVVTATPAHPVPAAIEGNTVIAKLPGGTADVRVVGPVVPTSYLQAVQSGHRSQQLPVPARFVASVTVRSGTVHLSSGSFTVESEDQVIHQPDVTAVGGGPVPNVLRRGQHVKLVLVSSLVPGDGGVRWAPASTTPLVVWTYVLEVD